MEGSFVVLTGASGAGKTTLARFIKEHCSAIDEVLFFDSIGVPSVERMESEYGSVENWQQAMTIAWMEKIGHILRNGRRVGFEGQMRIAFVQEALTAAQISNARIIFVDCDDVTRRRRLRTDRNQPELDNPVTMNWAAYLRKEALTTGSEILDTGARHSLTV
jgi:guanylate kinase